MKVKAYENRTAAVLLLFRTAKLQSIKNGNTGRWVLNALSHLGHIVVVYYTHTHTHTQTHTHTHTHTHTNTHTHTHTHTHSIGNSGLEIFK